MYQHGHFLAFDTHQTATALSLYALGLAGYATVKLLAPAFYALGDARTPMLVSMASVVINAVSAVALVHGAGMGYAGLALSLSLVSTFNALTLAALIRSRIGSGVLETALLLSLGKILLSAAVMGAIVYAVTVTSHTFLASARLAGIANIAFGVPVGALTFYAAASALGIAELSEARDAVFRKFRRSEA